jgi:hypothetical protein
MTDEKKPYHEYFMIALVAIMMAYIFLKIVIL